MKEGRKFWVLEAHQTLDEDWYELHSDKEGYDLLWRAQEKDTLLNIFIFTTKKAAIEYARRDKGVTLCDLS